MEKIKIITDSTSDISKELMDKYDVEVLPLLVNFGETVYRDGIDITTREMQDKIVKENVFPTTSQVNQMSFYDCYKKYIDEGYSIISIHISSKLSGTYQSASIAKAMLGTEKIKVIDSYNVSSGMALLIIMAGNMIKAGAALEEIESKLNEATPHIVSKFAFNSLDNLVRGGRLSKAAGIIGSVLDIKPILTIKNGELSVEEKLRGNKKATLNVVNFIEQASVKEGEPIMIVHFESKDILPAVMKKLEEKNIPSIVNPLGCVVGAHAGTDVCGVFYLENY